MHHTEKFLFGNHYFWDGNVLLCCDDILRYTHEAYIWDVLWQLAENDAA